MFGDTSNTGWIWQAIRSKSLLYNLIYKIAQGFANKSVNKIAHGFAENKVAGNIDIMFCITLSSGYIIFGYDIWSNSG